MSLPHRLAVLPIPAVELVMRHPVQRRNYDLITELLDELRPLRDARRQALAFYEFQQRLFGTVLAVQLRRDAVRQSRRRVEVGKLPDPGVLHLLPETDSFGGGQELTVASVADLGLGSCRGDPLLRARLVIEDIVLTRAERQLRAVGDALAWKVFKFERGIILALSGNQRTGPMTASAKKATAVVGPSGAEGLPVKSGLGYELGKVASIFEERRRFALLHDLTNCVRIGDLTEVTGEGYLLHEVKANDRGKDPKQQARMTKAVRAFNHGEDLPGAGPGRRIVRVDVRARTLHSALEALVPRLDNDGVAAMGIGSGRVLSGTSILGPKHGRDGRQDVQRWAELRAVALVKAGTTTTTPLVTANTGDAAGSEPGQVPFGNLPLPVEACARLICDFIVLESTASLTQLAQALEAEGMQTRIVLSPGPVDSRTPTRRSRSSTNPVPDRAYRPPC